MRSEKALLIHITQTLSDNLDRLSEETGVMKAQIVKMALSEYMMKHSVRSQ